MTKECSEYTGLAGGFCTITGSNLNAIRPGTKVIYTNPAVVGTVLSSDLYVDGPGNNDAYGHVDLNVAPGPTQWSGPLTFTSGTGRFSGFHATLRVTCAYPPAALVRGTDRTASPHPATTNKPKRNR